jgi:CubicO group peptidase (beta-lactamase class C family)
MKLKAIILVTAVLMLGPGVSAQVVDLSARVDDLFSKQAKKDSPGCAVAVIQSGRIVYKRGYGLANLDFDIPNSSTTVFNVASMAKQFTAMSVALLAQQGKISLDDDMRKYVPEIPDYGTPITIRHLAYHTSGIRDYIDLIELADDRIENVHTDQDILNILTRQKKLNFKPGEQLLYSNSGYVLLGIIVERVSGKSLRDFENEFIFQPLGMKHSLLYDNRTMVVKNRATGYVPATEGRYKMRASLWDRVGDGGMLTTVEDLFLWDQNFYAPKVGDLAVINLLTTPGTLSDGKKIGYTFGLESTRYKGLPVILHGGSINGFRAQMYRFPEQRFTAVCLCNNGAISPTSIVEKIADIYLSDHLKSDKNVVQKTASAPDVIIKRSEKELVRFTGVFANPAGEFARRLYIKTGKLFYSVSEGDDYELAPVGDNRFIMLGVPEKIELVVDMDQAGNPSQMSMIVDDGKPSVYPAVKAALDSPAQLAEYVGSYYSEELDAKYTLSLVGNKLVARKKVGDDLTLSPQFADVFGNSDRSISIRFSRGQNGAVTGFLLNKSRMKGVVFSKT